MSFFNIQVYMWAGRKLVAVCTFPLSHFDLNDKGGTRCSFRCFEEHLLIISGHTDVKLKPKMSPVTFCHVTSSYREKAESVQAADEQMACGTATERGSRSYLRQEAELRRSSAGLEEEAQGGLGERECEELRQVREGEEGGGREGAGRKKSMRFSS